MSESTPHQVSGVLWLVGSEVRVTLEQSRAHLIPSSGSFVCASVSTHNSHFHACFLQYENSLYLCGSRSVRGTLRARRPSRKSARAPRSSRLTYGLTLYTPHHHTSKVHSYHYYVL
jgi:hypothetical protein